MLAKKMAAASKRASLSDFDRFKVMVLKRKANGLIKKNANTILKKGSKAGNKK